MTSTTISIILLAALIVVSALVTASIYNRLVTLRQRVLNAYSQIDVQLKRRHDLIPNLVESVKGYMAHEAQTLQRVIAARNAAVTARASVDPRNASAIQSLAAAEQQLVAALGQFLVLKESYPQLKADQTTLRLMEELASSENRIAFARQAYNDAVMFFNTSIRTVPNNFLARPMGFTEASLFQLDDIAQREVVKVSLP